MKKLFSVQICKTDEVSSKVIFGSERDEEERKILRNPPTAMGIDIVLAFEFAEIKIREAMCPYLATYVSNGIRKLLETTKDKGIQDKRYIATSLGKSTRRYGVTFAHPESGEPCNIMVINDLWGGKYAYENRKTKKRSHTTRDLTTLLPFKFIPIRYNEEVG